jgi:EAL domain-containing protein (putative c-di-GMP-specific phosphodiesterase class I)
VGISVYPDDASAVDTLLRYADIAMYHAKESGRNTFRFYNPSINVLSLQRMKLAGFLAQAVKRGELIVVYQPQIDIRSRSMCHAEALVRWNHPTRGLLQPAEFIPLAEETGFIIEIDTWVLRTVCRQVRTWKDEGFDSFCLSVNLSARQFQSPDLVSLVSSAVEESGLPHDCLGLELTESAVMSNVERTADQLQELQRMGISISIDDFGTGYSSLSYLKKLPIDRLKIDKSFIRDIAQDPDDRAIISAVTSMARQMGIRTVAEGVETEEQLAFLRQSECDEAQGFLFSRPVTAGKFREFIEASR